MSTADRGAVDGVASATTEPAPSEGRPGGDHAEAARPTIDAAQYGLAAFLALVGGYVLYNGSQMRTGMSADYLPPQTFAYLVGSVLVLLAVLLAVATSRGSLPEAEEGEDVDLGSSTDVKTIVLLTLVLTVNVVFIETIGWAITGAILFTGAAWVLGSRHWVRDAVIGLALSFGSFYAFYLGLGVPLPAGILDGYL